MEIRDPLGPCELFVVCFEVASLGFDSDGPTGSVWRETPDPTKNESRMSLRYTTKSDLTRFGRMGFEFVYICGLGVREREDELGTTRSQVQ